MESPKKLKIGEEEEKRRIGEEEEVEEEGWDDVTCPYWNIDGDEAVDEACREYVKQVWESEGFDFEMPVMENSYRYCRYRTVNLEEDDVCFGTMTNRLVMEELVSDALEIYNKDKEDKVVCKEVLRANKSPSSSHTYYITFLAEETSPLGRPVLKNYQVEAIKLAFNKGSIQFCRPEPEKKKNIDEILKRFRIFDAPTKSMKIELAMAIAEEDNKSLLSMSVVESLFFAEKSNGDQKPHQNRSFFCEPSYIDSESSSRSNSKT